MKKTALILSAGALLAINANAAIIITGVMDGDLTGGEPKAIELYNTGASSFDLSSLTLEFYSNGNATINNSSVLSGTIPAGGFFYLLGTGDTPEFQSLFGTSGDFANTAEFTAVNSNGDDAYQLVDGLSTVLSGYGEIGVDGSGTAWDFVDSYAYRISNNTDTGVFDVNDYTYAGAGALDTLNASQQGAAVPFGTYTAVPEPQTYAAIAGLMVLGLAVYRRRK